MSYLNVKRSRAFPPQRQHFTHTPELSFASNERKALCVWSVGGLICSADVFEYTFPDNIAARIFHSTRCRHCHIAQWLATRLSRCRWASFTQAVLSFGHKHARIRQPLTATHRCVRHTGLATRFYPTSTRDTVLSVYTNDSVCVAPLAVSTLVCGGAYTDQIAYTSSI